MVTNLKGRCSVPQAKRAEILMAIEAVDQVLVFDNAHPRELIQKLHPDVVFKGTDYASREPRELPEYRDIQNIGAALIYLPVLFVGGLKISSSDIKRNLPGGVLTAEDVRRKAFREYMKKEGLSEELL